MCPTDRTAHTTAFDGPAVDHWLDRKIAQTVNASAVQDRSDWVLLRPSYVPFCNRSSQASVTLNTCIEYLELWVGILNMLPSWYFT